MNNLRLFLFCFAIAVICSMQKAYSSYFNLNSYYWSSITYSYSPSLAIDEDGVHASSEKTTFTYSFSPENVSDFGRGYAYLILSTSNDLTRLGDCYAFNLGRWNKSTSSYKKNVVLDSYCEKVSSFYSTGGGYSGVSSSLPQGKKYYHFILLKVYSTSQKKYVNVVITENTRTTINFYYNDPQIPEQENYDIKVNNVEILSGNSVYHGGDNVSVGVSIKNEGNVALIDSDLTSAHIKFYISNKATLSQNYNLLSISPYSYLDSSLPVGATKTYIFPLYLPGDSALTFSFPNNTALYLIAEFEGRIGESNTSNNSASTQIMIMH